VILSFAFGPAPMALVFNGYELAALIFAALISTTLIADGESHGSKGSNFSGSTRYSDSSSTTPKDYLP
jgi:Ca2+/H+ antiporter